MRHTAANLNKFLEGYVQVCIGQLNLVQQLLEAAGPRLHERVDVGHGAGIVHALGLLLAVHLADAVDPALDGLGVGLSVFNLRHFQGRAAACLRQDAQVKVKHARIRLLGTRLVQNLQSQPLILAIHAGDLDKGVDVANSRDIVWDKRLQFRLKLLHLGFVSVVRESSCD